ncbi:MAG: hypothetical protein CMM67_07920 [Rhodospirillaceae bacterium]|mgnify:CR=1 FL=1|nr:hypothetical protein [Rhodospirillaceae bacterium]OUT77148.1 MAG: hypothetical protein CBB83_08090 [Rhodospirillaceae bacterium TMED23]|tara:strand:- start:1651 stop:3117 length:1467 start_codon:yes stop_codon:yes gene_type:complete
MASKKIKVLLVNPPQIYYGRSLGFNVYFPLGLLYLAANIRDICEVKVLDCLVEGFQIQEKDEVFRYGMTFDELKKTAEDYSPDVIGFTIPFSAQAEIGIEVSDHLREACPNSKIVIGGPHASIRYQDLLEKSSADYCIVGEGEVTFRAFVESILDGKDPGLEDGVVELRDGVANYTPRKALDDLDLLPLPAYDLINYQDYFDSPHLYKSRSAIRKKSISMITSRGCPFNCSFCSIMHHMGKKYRYNSTEHVMKHIQFLVDEMGVENIHFEDDNLSLNKVRFEEILDALIIKKHDINWDTPNGIRADTLNQEKIRKIKESGCSSLQIAIESGNQEILNSVIRKDTDLTYVLQVIDWCHEVGLKLGAFYVIGFPGETEIEMQDTIKLALRLYQEKQVFPILLFATPLYGTELYKICVEKGYIQDGVKDSDFASATQFYGDPLITTEDFGPELLKKMAADFEKEIDKPLHDGALRDMLVHREKVFAEVDSR